MCNCSRNTGTICNQCSAGNPCGCPPNYSILPQPVPCGCCPDDLTYNSPTLNWPNGFCESSSSSLSAHIIVPAIPCTTCSDSIQADCVILPAIPCLGITAGTSLTAFLGFLCSSTFAEVILKAIAADSSVGSGLCQLVHNCPAGSSTTPIITGIRITFP